MNAFLGALVIIGLIAWYTYAAIAAFKKWYEEEWHKDDKSWDKSREKWYKSKK